MAKIKLIENFDAEQWLGEGHPIPEGCHLCVPEIHLSASRDLVYFTYADLLPRNWMSAMKIRGDEPKPEFMGSVIKVEEQDGSFYYRQTFPFACWSVKSLASVTRDHRAVYIDRASVEQMEQFADFRYVEGWSNPLPPRIEYRQTDGAYGRGFKPYYLKPGDWLLRKGAREIEVLSDEAVKTRLVAA